jgi:hypothetical protein
MTGDLLSAAMRGDESPAVNDARAWEGLLGQARSSRLLARLALRFEASGGLQSLHPGPRWHLTAALRLAERQQHVVRWEVDCIQRALAELATPVVLLKGAAYVLADLPAARGRLFADVDILVAERCLTQVEGALLAAGWIPQERDAYNDRYYRRWMHELPPLTHVVRGTTVDVHHTITPPTSAFHVAGASLLDQSRPLSQDGKLRLLQPVDMVLHSAVHLFLEGEFDHGLRDLLDLDDLLLHFGTTEPQFWSQLFARAQGLQLEVPLHHALVHVRRLFGTQPPAEFSAAVRKLQPPWLPRWLMARLLTVALRPAHPSCRVRGEAGVRWLLYIRSHWLRMPARLLLPHLVRKAWLQRFPPKTVNAAGAADATR